MDRTHRCYTRRLGASAVRRVRIGAAALLLGMALAPTCRADSSLQSAAPGGGPLSASAHLDFRVTVLASLALSAQASGVRVQGNSGVLTLQRGASTSDGGDGRAPVTSVQLQPHRQVVDTALGTPGFARGDLVTIASP
jgi:hypothetical protein